MVLLFFDEESQSSVISNEDGYFTKVCQYGGGLTLQMKYLGYRTLKFKVNDATTN